MYAYNLKSIEGNTYGAMDIIRSKKNKYIYICERKENFKNIAQL
jgi:hypothetical protein